MHKSVTYHCLSSFFHLWEDQMLCVNLQTYLCYWYPLIWHFKTKSTNPGHDTEWFLYTQTSLTVIYWLGSTLRISNLLYTVLSKQKESCDLTLQVQCYLCHYIVQKTYILWTHRLKIIIFMCLSQKIKVTQEI